MAAARSDRDSIVVVSLVCVCVCGGVGLSTEPRKMLHLLSIYRVTYPNSLTAFTIEQHGVESGWGAARHRRWSTWA